MKKFILFILLSIVIGGFMIVGENAFFVQNPSNPLIKVNVAKHN